MEWKVFAASFFIVFIVAMIGSLAIGDTVSSHWYLSNKPSFTPPGYVFGPAWTALYAMIAISLYLAWTRVGKGKWNIGIVFGANLFLNALWSVLFFGLRNPLLAFIDIVLMWITIILMIKVSCKIDQRAAWLLVPYLLWVTFATALNATFL